MALGIDLRAAPLLPERTQYAHHLGDPSSSPSEMKLGRESGRFIVRCRLWDGGGSLWNSGDRILCREF